MAGGFMLWKLAGAFNSGESVVKFPPANHSEGPQVFEVSGLTHKVPMCFAITPQNLLFTVIKHF